METLKAMVSFLKKFFKRFNMFWPNEKNTFVNYVNLKNICLRLDYTVSILFNAGNKCRTKTRVFHRGFLFMLLNTETK